MDGELEYIKLMGKISEVNTKLAAMKPYAENFYDTGNMRPLVVDTMVGLLTDMACAVDDFQEVVKEFHATKDS